MGRLLKEQPKRKFSDITDIEMVSNCTNVLNQAEYDDQAMEEHKVLGTELPDLMKKSLGLAREQINDTEKFNKQIAGGVLEGRIKLQELSTDGEKPSKFEIKDAATAEREMKQQAQQSSAGPVM